MKCPRCGLINPDTALRCDCGYDFQKGTVETPYFKQEVPKDTRSYLRFVIIVNLLLAILALAAGDPSMISGVTIWSVVVYGLYSQLAQKKNWARVALIFLTFPEGLILFFSREVRMFFLQKGQS